MKWFSNMKIATKLISGFCLVAVITAAVGALAISELLVIAESDTVLYEKNTVPIIQMGDVQMYFQRVRINTRDIVLATTEEERRKFSERIVQYRDSIVAQSAEFEKLIISQTMRDAFETFKQSRVAYGRDLERPWSL